MVGQVLPTAGLILAVLGSIFFGIATPTEASGVGAFGALLLAAANRKLSFRVLANVVRQTMQTTALVPFRHMWQQMGRFKTKCFR